MTKPNFTENAEAIFDNAVSATPLPFRSITKNGMIKLIAEYFGEDGEITEARMVQIIKENTPKPFLERGMKAIRPYITTDPSLGDL